MKTQIINAAIIILLTLFSACDKQEPLLAEPPKVVRLLLTGYTPKKLEFLYKDSVIAVGNVVSSGATFLATALIPIESQSGEIKIREEGSVDIIDTRTITSAPFEQSINIYYDGSNAYSQVVSYQVRGYASSGELEFLLDGNVIATGTSDINKLLTIPMNAGDTRELQVRKKGTTIPLITKSVPASPATGQSIKFFFDGINMVDNIQINPPANAANMAITAQFKSTYTTGAYLFTGGDEIDLVFYIRNKSTSVITKAAPEIRVTMPTNGNFASFELPPLPDANYEYKFDICTKGANTSPYNTSNAAIKPLVVNEGKSTLAGTSIAFEAGASKLFLIKDFRQLRTTPAPPSNIFIGQITDLSQYFQ
ncbi:hypothetical protein GFS24_23970 [Chitinophaga sp. SYP-B3965]|uniref:hypothetical protein n=1 Tax=Chitinophaga sp. SYP-B3965 TaxID=2663120 RepID=UPI0012997EF3|nr:hypothetical protein [Chitinophaga sp. SYP-B3965]MRG48198.1 hypothetical protein [Chitinophaga sp. SYP-B3965]